MGETRERESRDTENPCLQSTDKEMKRTFGLKEKTTSPV
jgi:hypothetical protein